MLSNELASKSGPLPCSGPQLSTYLALQIMTLNLLWLDCHVFCFTGHGIVAATSSIPSKYQTIVTDNSDRKGFGAQAKRFQGENYVVCIKPCT